MNSSDNDRDQHDGRAEAEPGGAPGEVRPPGQERIGAPGFAPDPYAAPAQGGAAPAQGGAAPPPADFGATAHPAPSGAPTYGNPGHDTRGYGAPGSGGYAHDDAHYGAGGYGSPTNAGTSNYDVPGYAATAGGYSRAQGEAQTGEWGGSHVGQPATKPAGSRTGRTIAIAAVVALLVGSGATAGTYALVNDGSSGTGSTLSVSTQAAPSPRVDGSVSAAAAAIGPSVVTINVSAGNAGGTGSGIVIKSDGGTGYILTNNHVVSLDSQTQASANQISVTLNDGSTKDATVVGTDPADDLAVIKVSASTLKAATFAKSSALTVGQAVVAVGAPLGLSNTVTSGIVSAIARPVTTGSQASASIFNAVQTDAAINPGNSGGPLVDLNGHVVGVNSAIAGTGSDSSTGQGGNIGIGFAIPSDEASRIAAQLIATGKATHAILGISVSGASQDNTGPTSGSGATVAAVQSGSPAEKAGIKKGDVITKIGGQRIDDSVGAIAATRSFAPGSTVVVTVQSGGETKTRSVTLGSSTDS